MKKYILIIFLFFSPLVSQAIECAQKDAYAAEVVVDYLDSWHNLNLAYKQFNQCDGGSIGEGFSEAVARLLVDQWSHIDQFLMLSSKDSEFKRFVLFHIDGTLNIEDLRKIKWLAETGCPSSARELCGDLIKEVETAIKNP